MREENFETMDLQVLWLDTYQEEISLWLKRGDPSAILSADEAINLGSFLIEMGRKIKATRRRRNSHDQRI